MSKNCKPRAKNSQSEVSTAKVEPLYDCIKLGIDWHAEHYRVVRMIDNGAPEAARRFSPEAFLRWAREQLSQAKVVHSCYEAGAGGFVLHRQLVALGIQNLVVTPRKLDSDHRGVQNDKTDARDLANDLDRFIRGNNKALRVVYVLTPEQEQQRAQSRQRKQLQQKRLAFAAQGRSLLLAQGRRVSNQWWKAQSWLILKASLAPWMAQMLEITRNLILEVDKAVNQLRLAIEKAAPKVRPKGMGALTFEEIKREVGDFTRFKNRKKPGGFAGLSGGVSSTADSRRDLSITKAGNKRLRTILVEAAWRWVIYQPQSPLIESWREDLHSKAHRGARKRAIVAVARQLFVDLWRWQTGRRTPEQLGWVMTAA